MRKLCLLIISQEAEGDKTGLLYITVKERSSCNLHNDIPTDVITDYCGGRLVITVTMWGTDLASLLTTRDAADQSSH